MTYDTDTKYDCLNQIMTSQFKLISEIFKSAQEAETIEQQAVVLKANDSLPLRQLLKAALDPKIEFDVEIPTYTKTIDAPGCCSNNLYLESRRLYVFLKNSTVSLTPARRSALLAQILETVDADDAELFVHIIQKDISHYNIHPEAVKLAFPGLI